MKKNAIKQLPRLLFLLALFSLSACSGARKETDLAYPIGGIWNVPLVDGKADWNAASALAQEQQAGFALANEQIAFDVTTFSEGNRQDDVQTAVRSMAEGQAEGASDPVAALLGATSNEATTRTVALANFFNLPMIVPSASGDNLLPENNLWAFQLSASNSTYAQHILGTVLNQQIVNQGYEEGFEPEFRIAILYEQNTYGETAAVETATVAMEQAYSIVLYDKFPANNPSQARLNALVNLALDQDAQLVFMITSNPDVAIALTDVFTNLSDARIRPILVGMAAGFTSQEFMASPQLESTYVLRQQIDFANCPAEIKSLYAAQNYAAANLLADAVEQVELKLNSEKKAFSFKISTPDNALPAYRELLRDAIKVTNSEQPCLGQVAFDNAGHNKYLRFEIVTAESGQPLFITDQEFVTLIRQKIDLSPSE